MAGRHDSGRSGYSSLITRRGLLKTVGAGAAASVGGVAGAAGRAAAAPTVVDLGKQGLRDGDDVSPYIDEFWTDGVEVRIPAGSYTYDGSGLHGKRGNCSLVGSDEGVEFHRADEDASIRPTIQCTHGTMRVENVTVRGAKPPAANMSGSRWRFDALRSDARIEVVNVNHPDGTRGCSDSLGFLTYSDHRGTILYKNCYVANMGNSSFYVNLGYRSGVENPVIVDNCTIVNPNGAIRGGHNGTVYRDCTIVWRDEPNHWANCSSLARGIRWDAGGENELVENCHFHFESNDVIGASGGALEFEDYPIGGTVRDLYVYNATDGAMIRDHGGMDGWSFENVNVVGPGNTSGGDYSGAVGDAAPDLRNENAVWMPESQTVRPRAGGKDAGGGAGSASANGGGANRSDDGAGQSGGGTIATGGGGSISTRSRSK